MKVLVEEYLYHRGTTIICEDGFWPYPPIVGVWDGFSAPYCQTRPPHLFEGSKTGGRVAKDAILNALANHRESDAGIEDIVRQANASMRVVWDTAGIPLSDASQLGGATFVLAHIQPAEILCPVEILQGGDCYAVWVEKSGEVGITPNLVRPYELNLRKRIAELMNFTDGNRQKMWELFYPALCASRQTGTNTKDGYAVLNGQPAVSNWWRKVTLPAAELSLLLLFSDGLVPFRETEDEARLAQTVVNLYRNGGLHEILAWTRCIEEEEANRFHQTFAEATALAIGFSE